MEIRKQLDGISEAYKNASNYWNRCKADLKCSKKNIRAMPFTDKVALLVKMYSPDGIGKTLLKKLDRSEIDSMAKSIVEGTLEKKIMQSIFQNMPDDYGEVIISIVQMYTLIVLKDPSFNIYCQFWSMGYDMLVLISGAAYVLSKLQRDKL